MIGFNCHKCGKAYKVAEHLAGKRAACKACGGVNVIPRAEGAGRSAPAARVARGESDPAGVGVGADSGRGAAREEDPALRFRDDEEERTPARARAAHDETPGDEDEAYEPAPARSAASGRRRACPECNAGLDAGEVFCTNCGYDLKSGRRVVTKVVREAPAAAPPVYAPAKRPGGGGEGGGKFATALVVFGVIGILFPLTGKQFKVLLVFGPTGSAYAGLFIALFGASLMVIGRQIPAAVTSCVIAVAALGISLAFLPDFEAEARKLLAAEEAKARAEQERKYGGGGGGGTAFAVPGTERPATSVPPAPGDDEWHVQGRPKVSVNGRLNGFSPFLHYTYVPVPPGGDAVEFYRPGLRRSDAETRFATVDVIVKTARDRAKAAAAVADLVRDASPSVRMAVVNALGQAQGPAGVAALIAALNDGEVEIRKAAIRYLAQSNDEAAIEPLAARVNDDRPVVLAALQRFGGPTAGEKVARAYATMLGSSDVRLRADAVAAIMARDPANGPGLVINLIGDAEPSVRHNVMARLADAKYEPALPRIAERLRDDRAVAVANLIKYGAAAEPVAIAKAKDGGDPAVRAAALEVLAAVGTAACLPVVRELAVVDDLQVSAAARVVWAKLAPSESSELSLALLDLTAADAGRKARAFKALAAIPPDARQRGVVARKLFEAYVDPALQPPATAAAAGALKAWADQDVKDALLLLARPEAEDAKRKRAIPVLAELRDARAIPPIAACMAAAKESTVAEDALQTFGAAAEDELIKMLRNPNVAIALRAIALLEEVGTRKCLPPLAQVALANHPIGSPRAREAAAAIKLRLGAR